MKLIVVMLVGALQPCALAAWAQVAPTEICEQVTRIAAQQSGVPIDILRAISLTETGRTIGGKFLAWPWAVNMEGDDAWFDTRDEATKFALQAYALGARSFDVGCFQINYRWHGEHFASIEQMFDPVVNAKYAAKLLSDLYAESGSWSAAAGAYHSRTPEYANRYTARFESILANLTVANPPAQAQAGLEIPDIPDIVLAANGAARLSGAPRVNRFPLLQQGNQGGRGSLVPLSHSVGSGLLTAATAPVIQ